MKSVILSVILLGSALLAAAGPASNVPSLMPVLCLASEDTAGQGLTDLDPEAVAAYRKAGFELHFDYYQNITPALLARYPLVVGMIPQLHAGTCAIDEQRGTYLDDYLKNGGGLILIPGPSYYTADDFTRRLNPFLQRYGNELLNETPRDTRAENNLTQVRALAYRYLKTANLNRTHEVTRDIPFLYLPLGFSDAYLRTYTMKPDAHWTVLASGEATARSVPWKKASDFRHQTGTYAANPPLLAVRDVGKGKLAVFTTASRYFLYDAFHWAFGEGYVLREGHGLDLMSNLFRYVGNKHYQPVPYPAKQAPAVTGNLPVIQEKREWVQYVLTKLMPSGFGVRNYIDCGALSDANYSKKRGAGVLSDDYQSWIIRRTWLDVFHPTAASARACDKKSFAYRFDGLDPKHDWKLALLLWSTQDAGARDLEIQLADGTRKTYALPRYEQAQGPRFEVLDIPSAAIAADGTLTVRFARGAGGVGEFTGIAELWLLERNAPAISADRLLAEYDSLVYGVADRKLERKMFKGLIGARSPCTNGQESIAALAKTARECGLDFLIFTDPVAELSAEKLAALRRECAASSGNGFQAIPGIDLTASWHRERRYDLPQSYGPVRAGFYGEITALPDAKTMNDPYTLFWKFFGGELAGGRKTVGNLITPGKNALSPFFQRFWRGFALHSCDAEGRELDDAAALYRELTAAGYGPYAQNHGEYTDSAAIRRDAQTNFTQLSGFSDGTPLDALYSGIASSGPVIDEVSFASDVTRDGEIGNGDIFRTAIRTLAKLRAHYAPGIARVTIFASGKPIRVFYPRAAEVNIVEPIQITGQTELYFQVEGNDGREAVTTGYSFTDDAMRSAMCADNQNSICSVSRPPSRFIRDEREMFLQHSYWHTGEAQGQLGIMRDARDLVPRVIETGIIQLCKYFQPMPMLTLANGSTELHIQSKMKIAAAGAHGNVITYESANPEAWLNSFCSITSFRPAADGNTIALVELDLTFRKALPGKDIRDFTVLRAGLMPNFPENWHYAVETAPGTFAEGMLSGRKEPLALPLAPYGIAALYPNNLANLVIISLTDSALGVSLDNLAAWNCRERLSVTLPHRDYAAGEKLRLTFLVMLAQENIENAATLPALKQNIADRSEAVAKVLQGKLQSHRYGIDARAEDYAFRFQGGALRGRDPLPVRVSGLNGHWSAGILLDGEYTPCAQHDGIVLTTIPAARLHGEITIGNPVLSNDPDAMVEFDGVTARGVRMRVHNPAAQLRLITLRSNPAFAPVIPAFAVKLTLPPGGSLYVSALGPKMTMESIR